MSKDKQQGVTLVEAMITLAVAGILLTVVAPNIREMVVETRIASELNEVSAVVQMARNTAVNEQTTVTVCATSDYQSCSTNWNLAKMAFIDSNTDGNRGSTEDLLASTQASASDIMVTSTQASLQFSGLGTANAEADIKFCDDERTDRFARSLSISLQGRVKLSTDSNNDGIYELPSGTALSCS